MDSRRTETPADGRSPWQGGPVACNGLIARPGRQAQLPRGFWPGTTGNPSRHPTEKCVRR